MRTSWQTYVDTTLLGSGFVSQAAIFSIDRPIKLAASKCLDVTNLEATSIIKGFTEPDYLINSGLILSENAT